MKVIHQQSVVLAILVSLLSAMLVPANIALAEDLDAIYRTWNRTDWPVSNGTVSRTWMWGPPLTGAMQEAFDGSPNGSRLVMYFDKSRMEITFPDAVDDGLWYVTNGLLAKELATGQMQTGLESFEPRQPAQFNVAGDPGDVTAPTYATFGSVMHFDPIPTGWNVTQFIHRDGRVTADESLERHGVTAAQYVPETDHNVASVFWDFMRSSGRVYEDRRYVTANLFPNPFYATGFPITEPYWTWVNVLGTPHEVLVQVFERRVLTYTPTHPPGWRVEAGNVGRHYYEWRYGALPTEPAPTIPAPPEPLPEPQPAPDASPFMDPLLAELQGMVNGWDGQNAVSVTDLQTGRTISVNGDRPQLAACVVKIFMMMGVAQDISAGKYTHDQIADLVWEAMGPSHVPEARELIKLIGDGSIARGIARMNGYMQDLGMANSIVTHPPGYPGTDYGFGYGDNVLTTNDLNRALAKIYHRQAGLTEAETQYLLWSMTLAIPGQSYSLGGGIPGDATLYHKIGLLYSPWSTWNDSGIVVFNSNGREYAYAISYMGQDMGPSWDDWKKAYYRGADVSGAAWRTFSAAY